MARDRQQIVHGRGHVRIAARMHAAAPRKPDAHGDVPRRAADHRGHDAVLLDARGQRPGRVVRPRGGDRELVPPVAAQEIAPRIQRRPDQRRERAKNLVALHVAERFVDHAEVVDIDKHHRHLVAPAQRGRGPRPKRRCPRQPRQRICLLALGLQDREQRDLTDQAPVQGHRQYLEALVRGDAVGLHQRQLGGRAQERRRHDVVYAALVRPPQELRRRDQPDDPPVGHDREHRQVFPQHQVDRGRHGRLRRHRHGRWGHDIRHRHRSVAHTFSPSAKRVVDADTDADGSGRRGEGMFAPAGCVPPRTGGARRRAVETPRREAPSPPSLIPRMVTPWRFPSTSARASSGSRTPS